ncbi:hypothetical protein K504DRAFT_503772 [Pleomassaria siparia CBS 279.74]|uniref:Uncharacterized protein n=1 Tax=Pleomassaria siparia CBS 279.74 TaxID=1314801 RepID=A0A6G1K408_9PLEO|nr:hypothetical protein K504DRAFT_503772 [Pleomassaria siparia CBS 279.74]
MSIQTARKKYESRASARAPPWQHYELPETTLLDSFLQEQSASEPYMVTPASSCGLHPRTSTATVEFYHVSPVPSPNKIFALTLGGTRIHFTSTYGYGTLSSKTYAPDKPGFTPSPTLQSDAVLDGATAYSLPLRSKRWDEDIVYNMCLAGRLVI